MNYYQIPFNGTFPNGQKIDLQCQIVYSDEIYNRYKDHASGDLYSESGLLTKDAATRINQFFGDNILNKALRLYTIKWSGDWANIPTVEEKNMLSLMDIDPDVLFVDYDFGGNQPYSSNNTFKNGIVSPTTFTYGFFQYSSVEPFPHTIMSYANNAEQEGFLNIATKHANLNVYVFPSDVWNDDGTWKAGSKAIRFTFYFEYTADSDGNITKIQSYTITMTTPHSIGNLDSFLSNFNTKDSGMTDNDTDNPFGPPTDPNAGGDGDNEPPIMEPVDYPDLPDKDASDLGFITIYNPTKSQLKALSAFLWSGAFDLNSYKKLFSDPMQSIIGLALVPVQPNSTGSKNVIFGTIDSGVSMTTCGQYKKVDCGTVRLKKKSGSFLDSSAYTKISIYLPYIGIRPLSADDLMGGSIGVRYNVDVLTGACAAFVKHSSKGVLYAYNGSCITNIPITSQNFSGAIQNAVSAVASAAGVLVGAATGAAPLTAMSAMGLLNSAANTALNSKPTIQRSGNLGGSAGILSVQKPFIIIERPDYSLAGNIKHYTGYTSNFTASLGSCSGFTLVEYVHLNGIHATSQELGEIESLLKEGVML